MTDHANNADCQVVLDAATKRIAISLARYWSDNPLACDTAEGIHQWWLLSIDDVPVERVVHSLAWLRDRGLVERIFAADGRARFRRAGGHDSSALGQLAALGEPREIG